MKKIIALALAAGSALSVAGCSAVDSFEAWLTSPQTAATLVVLENATAVFICDVSTVANLSAEVEAAVNAGASLQGTTKKIYTSSSIVCSALGGIVTGSTSVPAGTAVVR